MMSTYLNNESTPAQRNTKSTPPNQTQILAAKVETFCER
jgi:hypothetical protein